MKTYGCHLSRLLLLGACGLVACGGGGNGGGGGGDIPGPGPGENPFDNPTGSTFALPSGITLQGPLVGTDPSGACTDAPTIGGGIDLVDICAILHNGGTTETIVDFPPGLIVVSEDPEVQSGTQVQDQQVVVPPAGDATFRWSLYCLHLERHATSPGDLYTLGPVSNQPGLREIISLVAGKDLGQSFTGPGLVQQAIWEVSDGGGLTDSTRAMLQALP